MSQADRDARVSGNMGLVHLIARRHRGRGLDMEDMAQLGALGLMQAAERFDPGRGRKFTTYATFWVREAIGRGIMDGGSLVRVPPVARREAAAVARRLGAMAAGGPPPDLAEVLDAMVADGSIAASCRRIGGRERFRRAYLACRPRPDGEAVEQMAGAAGPEAGAAMIDAEEREQVRLALPLLPERQRTVLTRSCGLDGGPPMSDAAIGAMLEVSPSTVLWLRHEAVRRLRELVTAGPTRRG